jgi:hypothetical protein
MTPSGMRGLLNDAISIYFADATLSSAFVVRWCVGSKAEMTSGVFHVRGESRCLGLGRGHAPDAVTGPQLQERSEPDPAEQASATAPK